METKPNTKTQRSWFLALFGTPFFLVGAGFLVMSVIPTLYDGWRMQSWHSVQGKMLGASLKTSTSDDSTTYQAIGHYRYNVAGKGYQNDRVAINSGSDNVGDFQEKLASRLRHYHRNNYPITVWYAPANPADSIIDRSIRWGLLAFKLIFVVLFGGVGFGLIVFGLRGKKTIDSPEAEEKPWLANPDWSGGVIRSGAKTGMYFIWGFAVVWNLISFPAVIFGLPEILTEKKYIGLLILLFPIVGIGMIAWAIKQTLGWRRFGITPLTMDPFPGSIGGDVAGSIQVNTSYDSNIHYKVTLSCIRSYVSGSGKNRSRSESVKWQDEGYARMEPFTNGIRLQFRFEVPDGLPASEEHSNDYHLWRLNISADMPGIDLDRDFEIPVYATSEQSAQLSFKSTDEQPVGVARLTAQSLLPLSQQGPVNELYYPMLRRPGMSIGLILFGAVFGGVGLFLWGQAAKEGFMLYMMSAVFNLVGWGIVLGGIYSALNSLRIQYDGQSLSGTRRLLGIPIKQFDLNYRDILSIESKRGSSSSSGNKHKIQYDVIVKVPGDKITLAEHLDSASKAELVVQYFEDEFQRAGSGPRFEL